MNLATRRLHDFLNSVWVVLILAVLSALSGTIQIWDKFRPSVGSRTGFAVGLSLVTVVLAAAVFYSIRVRQTNAAFRTVPAVLHKINHDYRDVLSQMFGKQEIATEDTRRRAELLTLQSACQKIANIYSALTHVQCTTTVKLITKEEDGRAFCEMLVRSETNCKRDEGHPHKFQLHTGANTAFDTALGYTPGVTSHFFAADIAKERAAGRYRNERPNCENFYRTAIVVPIRYIDPAKVGTLGASDHIGFLAVDAPSPNRLNDGYHVEFLAAFADQMYNFMSLMRGKFGVPRNNQ